MSQDELKRVIRQINPKNRHKFSMYGEYKVNLQALNKEHTVRSSDSLNTHEAYKVDLKLL